MTNLNAPMGKFDAMPPRPISSQELGAKLLPVLGLNGKQVIALAIKLDGPDSTAVIEATMLATIDQTKDFVEIFKKYHLLPTDDPTEIAVKEKDITGLDDHARKWVQVPE